MRFLLYFFIITLEIIAGLSKLKPHSLGTLLSSVITDSTKDRWQPLTEKICKENEKKCINKSMSFDRVLTLQQIFKSENNFIAKKSEKILIEHAGKKLVNFFLKILIIKKYFLFVEMEIMEKMENLHQIF